MIGCLFAVALGYLDLAETAVKAYDDARMEEYVREAETVGVQEHGFPRLASNLGRLVAAGRMAEKKPMLERMLTVSCAPQISHLFVTHEMRFQLCPPTWPFAPCPQVESCQ